MIIEKVVDRFMDENTYILGDEKTKKCAVIDPGGSIIDIFNIIKQHGLTVEYIILTHGHGDHICRVPEIQDQQERNAEHNCKDDSGRCFMTCHKEHNSDNSRCIKYKTCHSVCIKPCILHIMRTKCIDDVQNHGKDDQPHTKSYRYDKYSIEFSDKRKCSHVVNGP